MPIKEWMVKEDVTLYTMKYFPAMRKKLPSATIQMGQGALCSMKAVSRERQTLRDLTATCKLNEPRALGETGEWWLIRAGGWGDGETLLRRCKLAEVRVTSSGRGCRPGDYSWWHCIMPLEVAKRGDFKCSHHKKRNGNYVTGLSMISQPIWKNINWKKKNQEQSTQLWGLGVTVTLIRRFHSHLRTLLALRGLGG